MARRSGGARVSSNLLRQKRGDLLIRRVLIFLRHDEADACAHGVLGPDAEDALGSGIEPLDDTFVIERHDPVENRRDTRTGSCLVDLPCRVTTLRLSVTSATSENTPPPGAR